MDLEDLRLRVYREFVERGAPPSTDALATSLDLTPGEVEAGLRELARARHLVLDAAGHIVMAHPFAAVPMGFSVMGRNTLWWGGCIWDAFALPALLPGEGEVLVATRCPACAAPHAWNVGRDAPPQGAQVAHFLVPAARMWDDVVHTCRNQRAFCSTACVDRWLAQTGQARGYVTDLATVWRLARHWYDGRLEPGYVRREPAEAAAYLRSVGLSGPFWGLEPR
ncbi:MAG TPA: organomercurial lyase [Candidatus Polarisedimenticolaceae bacterium]|nr:organomercurial lyase [Candidatus Polarisedimenticolaceae bacterium]